ncbi:MAG: hypothetical protein AUH85_14135 [Chloroflexi bacterium 13_1_40CM_4_68_4]|nr:MAG: hypothetical protein AUH85_14135 [Chloroflexi bacterium 13_1_40CM_4_68_4]
MTGRIRPDLFVLWPAWISFPIFGLAVLTLGVQASDGTMIAIGLFLLALNIAIVVDHAYFTTLGVEGDALVFRSRFGFREERLSVGGIQRIDAKRYPTTHGGAMSAPNLVARGRADSLRVNTKPYRREELRRLVLTLRAMNPAIELDDYWSAVVEGRDPETETVARSRW